MSAQDFFASHDPGLEELDRPFVVFSLPVLEIDEESDQVLDLDRFLAVPFGDFIARLAILAFLLESIDPLQGLGDSVLEK